MGDFPERPILADVNGLRRAMRRMSIEAVLALMQICDLVYTTDALISSDSEDWFPEMDHVDLAGWLGAKDELLALHEIEIRDGLIIPTTKVFRPEMDS